MAIGSAIVLIVLGAILAYGVEVEVAGLDLYVIGLILMAAGVVGGIIGVVMAMTRRHHTSTQEVHRTADGEVIHTDHQL